MATSAKRAISITRIGQGRYTASNIRGGRIDFGTGEGSDFTPVELLLAAIGGCSGIDVDLITAKRAEPTSFRIDVTGQSARTPDGNHLEDIEVTFRIAFPDDDGGESARAMLPTAITRSHDRLCTVSRTVERGTPVRMIAGEPEP